LVNPETQGQRGIQVDEDEGDEADELEHEELLALQDQPDQQERKDPMAHQVDEDPRVA